MTRLKAFGLGVLLAGLAVAAEDALPPQEHVLDYESRAQRNVVRDPDIPVDLPASEAAAAPDPAPPPWQDAEDALWPLLRAGRLDELGAEIQRIRSEWPDWEAPDRLLHLAEAARIREAIATARAAGDDRRLIALWERHPAYFGCAALGNAWALAEARGRIDGDAEEAAVYRDLLARCPDRAARVANLQKLRALVPPETLLAVLLETAGRDPGLAMVPAITELERNLRMEITNQALAAGDAAAAVAVLEPAAARIEADRDAQSAGLLAQALLAGGRPEAALAWEERLARWGESRPLAFANARLAGGDEAGALAVAEAAAGNHPDAARLAFGLRTARAATAGDCRAVLSELEQAEQWGSLSDDERRLRAWALEECDRHEEAGDLFAELYAETGDTRDAQGLVVSDWSARRLERTAALAADAAGPLAERLPPEGLPTRHGTVAYNRLALAPGGYVEVLHRRGGSVWGGLGYQTRQGDGPGRLDAWRAPLTRASLVRDASQWRVDLDRVDLASDAARPGDWPLSIAGPYTPIVRTSTDGLEGIVAWIRDGDFAGGLDLEAGLGVTPTGQDIDPTFTARLGLADTGPGDGWRLAIARDSVRESVTSWTGTGGALVIGGTTTILPFDWGRVTRNSITLSGYRAVGDFWEAAGSLRAGLYTGHNVPDNTGGELYGELQRALASVGPWRFSGGPWVYASGFEENLGRFGPGHGGYFSPAWLGQAGLSLRASGDAGPRWYLDARLDLGWQRHEEDAALLIPDGDLREQFLAATGLTASDLGVFESRTRSGFAGGLEIQGMRRIGNSAWHVGGFLGARLAPQYDEATAMVVLRYGSDPASIHASDEFRRLFRQRRQAE